MRRRQKLPACRFAALPLVAFALAAPPMGMIAACGGGRRDSKPVAMVASSPQSAAAFEAIREAFGDPEHTTPADLRARIERFIAQFPEDGLVPRARVVLALAALRGGDLTAADAQLALTADGPRGTTQELWIVA